MLWKVLTTGLSLAPTISLIILFIVIGAYNKHRFIITTNQYNEFWIEIIILIIILTAQTILFKETIKQHIQEA